MKPLILALALVLTAPWALAQTDCNQLIVDQVGALRGQEASIAQASSALVNQGADVRIRVLANSGGNLDSAEKQIEKSCPSWQGNDGGRKSTLLVMMVSKEDRKVGLYYGSAWHRALDAHWNRIKQDYLVPHLRDGDYPAAFVAAEQQLAKRMQASSDEALHPSQSQTINQAADYSGLWHVLELLMALVAIGLIGWAAWAIAKAWRRQQEKLTGLRQIAIGVRSEAIRLASTVDQNIREAEALNPEAANVRYARIAYDVGATDIANVGNSVRMDPYQEKLQAGEYENITYQYNRIIREFNRAAEVLAGEPAEDKTPPSTPANEDPVSPPTSQTQYHHHDHRSARVSYTPAPTPAPSPEPVASSTIFAPTTIITSYEEEPVRRRYREPDPEPERSSESSRKKDDDEDGGSSSWSSSSSSSSDSGGSSDFGSSDSGGGGSSDF